MQRLGRYALLAGLLFLMIGAYRAWIDHPDWSATLIAGGVFLAVGFAMVAFGRDTPSIPDFPSAVPDAAPPRQVGSIDDSVLFSVTESIEERHLPHAERWLDKDARVMGVTVEEGRYYANPDRNDLPEWFALRVATRRADRDAVMQDLQAALPADARGALKVAYF